MVPVSTAEIKRVSALAQVIWPASFKDILSPGQIEYMMEMMYSEKSLKQQAGKKGHEFWILEINGSPSGYLALEHHRDASARSKVHKIYLTHDSQGTGAGRFMMDFASAEAKKNGSQTLYLNVNRYNKAVKFYEHYGFKILKVEDIDIGNGYLMEDYVMEKQL
ncbi:MAG: GNAT family N-acetyltransferase [Cytophagaceae bacterium]|nr:GNAT family N-acetyltransferase [Cytophagaceae bacterium]